MPPEQILVRVTTELRTLHSEPTAIVSLAVSMVVTGAGFYLISRQRSSQLHLVVSGIFMGLGMSPCITPAWQRCGGRPSLAMTDFSLRSPVIAIGASTAPLWLAFQTTDLGLKPTAALAMGVAISGMHYTGMQAAIFCRSR